MIPGGGIDEGETAVQAACREAKEETNLDVLLGPKLWQRPCGDQIEICFLVTEFTGDLALGGPESTRQAPDNVYEFVWLPLAEVNEKSLYPGRIDVAALEEALE